MKKKIVITGGHLTPALAVIDELQKKDCWEIIFIGRKYASEMEKTPSVESQIIAERGIIFFSINAGRFFLHFNRYSLISFLKIPLGFFQALYYLLRLRPQVILSFGGYLSVPVVFAGWILGIPSLTHEQTVVQGLANKVNSIFAKKVAVSWPGVEERFPSRKVVLTGNPIRKEIFKVNKNIWQVLNFPENLPMILITGGNQGSHTINITVESVLPQILKLGNVFHQCGHLGVMGDFEKLEAAREKLSPNLKRRYHVKKFSSGEEMGTILNKADLVIGRSGANTITEIAALGKPSLLIPHPWNYSDEQTKNALLLAKVGIAEVVLQEDLVPETLLEQIGKMIKNLDRYRKNIKKAKKLVSMNAAQKIVSEVEKII